MDPTDWGWVAAHPAVAHVFVDALDDECTVAGPDGHHLQRVRRLRTGEVVTAADGDGTWRGYEIVRVTPGELDLVARTPRRREPDLVPAVAVACAPVKGGGFDDTVARLTELGVARVVPLVTARTVVRWGRDRAPTAIERARHVAREAAMQCRRARVPRVEEPCTPADLVGRPGLVVADRAGMAPAAVPRPEGGEWTVLVGPEGGFDPAELEQLDAAPRLAVGPYVLRALTAPVGAAAVLVARATPVPDVGHREDCILL